MSDSSVPSFWRWYFAILSELVVIALAGTLIGPVIGHTWGNLWGYWSGFVGPAAIVALGGAVVTWMYHREGTNVQDRAD